MYRRTRSVPGSGGVSGTLSDDSEDGQGVRSIDFTRLNGLAPVSVDDESNISHKPRAEDSSSHVAPGATLSLRERSVFSSSDDATFAGGFEQIDPELPQVKEAVAKVTPPKFQAPPWAPALTDNELKQLSQWAQFQVRNQVELHAQPWYQYIEHFSTASGIPMTRLVKVRSIDGGMRSPSLPRSPQPQASQPQRDNINIFLYPQVYPSEEGSGNAGQVVEGLTPTVPGTPSATPGPGTPLSTPARTGKGKERIRGQRLFGNSGAVLNPADAAAAEQSLRQQLLAAINDPASTPQQLQLIQQKIDLVKKASDRNEAPVAEAAAGGAIVFVDPIVKSTAYMAHDEIKYHYMDTLGKSTVEDMMYSKDFSRWFALIAGALANRGEFVGGRHPLRATDYMRYGEGFQHGLLRFRSARYRKSGPVESHVYLDAGQVSRDQMAKRNLAPWCYDSPFATTNAGAGYVVGQTSSGESFSSALSAALNPVRKHRRL